MLYIYIKIYTHACLAVLFSLSLSFSLSASLSLSPSLSLSVSLSLPPPSRLGPQRLDHFHLHPIRQTADLDFGSSRAKGY